MLGNSLKGRDADLKMDRTDGTKAYGQADGKGVGLAAKRAKSGVPQSTQRGELKVYRAGSSEGRLPVPSTLRKQRSMTNLAVLTDAEKKLHLYEPKWCDDMAKPGAGQPKAGKPKTAGGGGGAGGGAPLSRNLSKSEHSLFQGKPKPFSPLAAPSAQSKLSRIPRGPYAEVKPLSKAPEDGKSDDELLSSKAKANAKKQGAGAGGESCSKGPGEEGGDKPFLKVDPELVVTVLGDLEQLLFSQILGEYGRITPTPLCAAMCYDPSRTISTLRPLGTVPGNHSLSAADTSARFLGENKNLLIVLALSPVAGAALHCSVSSSVSLRCSRLRHRLRHSV